MLQNILCTSIWGTGIRGLMRGTATLPQCNQELLVVRDKVGRPQGELGVSKSMEYDIFPFSALTLLVGRHEGHPTCKKNWMLVCWWWWFDWSFARFIGPVVTTTSIILCFNKLANPGPPGKWPLKRREREKKISESRLHTLIFDDDTTRHSFNGHYPRQYR